MARPPAELQEILAALPEVEAVYFQPDQNLMIMNTGEPTNSFITYERDGSWTKRADNILYWGKKRYTVTVIDRRPDSLTPDRVEELPYSTFDRKFARNGLHHTVFQMYF